MVRLLLTATLGSLALLLPAGAGSTVLWQPLRTPSALATTIRDVYEGGSIAAAVEAANGGDIVVVHGGTYPQVVLSKQFAVPVIIRGAPREDVTVGGFSVASGAGYRISGLKTNGGTVVFNGGHDVAFSNISCTLPADVDNATSCFYLHDSSYNLTIANSTLRGGWVGIHVYSPNAGPGAGWVRNVTISDNDISGAAIDDIHLDGVDGAVITHNAIHDPQANTQHNDGIQTQASNNLRIERNTFWFTTVPPGPNIGTAIMLGNLPAVLPDRKVTNTFVVNNLVAHWQPGRALILDGTEATWIVNNTFVDNGTPLANDASITVAHQGAAGGQNPGLEIWNNILKSVYYEPGAVPPAFFDTNLVLNRASGARGSHVVVVSPRFLNRTTYALAATSRARKRGLKREGTPGVDIDGRRRPLPPGLGARS
jgi:hypothetical protein